MHGFLGRMEISRVALGRGSSRKSAAAMDGRSDGIVVSGRFVRCTLAQGLWEQAGIFVSAGVLGFADVDALVISMAKNAGVQVPAQIAARAIAFGVLTNMVLKLVVGVLVGVKRFAGLSVSVWRQSHWCWRYPY